MSEWTPDELAEFLVEEKDRLIGQGEDWDMEVLMEALGLDIHGVTLFVRRYAEGQQLELEMMARKALDDGNAAGVRLAQLYVPLMMFAVGTMLGRALQRGDEHGENP